MSVTKINIHIQIFLSLYRGMNVTVFVQLQDHGPVCIKAALKWVDISRGASWREPKHSMDFVPFLRLLRNPHEHSECFSEDFSLTVDVPTSVSLKTCAAASTPETSAGWP